jgi:hypothetical protein
MCVINSIQYNYAVCKRALSILYSATRKEIFLAFNNLITTVFFFLVCQCHSFSLAGERSRRACAKVKI